MPLPARARRSGRNTGRPAPRGTGGWILVVAAAVTVMISASPSSLASWNGADTVDAGTVDAGTLNAAIAAGTATPTTASSVALGVLTDMLPGESRGLTFTVRNTGNVDMVLAAQRGPTTSTYLSLDVAAGACAAVPLEGAPMSATPVAIGSILPPSTNATFCLRVTLNPTAAANLQGVPIGGFALDLTAGSSS